jgi:hypothetical protein
MDNANPTVLSATDLPTRRGRNGASSTKEPGSEIQELMEMKSHYLINMSDLSDPESGLDSDEDGAVEPIDEQEIYGASDPQCRTARTNLCATDLISTISDPEHPLSLGSLAVVNLPDIHITPSPCLPNTNTLSRVLVEITPTITHCSLATAIGLGVRVRLEQSLPPNFRVDVRVKEGTHSQADQVNKQLADRERVAAALENRTLMGVIKKMLETCV